MFKRRKKNDLGPPTPSEPNDSIYTKDVDFHVADGGGRKKRRRALLDTGAQVNIMARDVQEALGYELEPFGGHIQPFGSKPVKPLGLVRGVEWNFKEHAKTYTETFYVFDTDQFDSLIGKPFIEKHNLFNQNNQALSTSGVGRGKYPPALLLYSTPSTEKSTTAQTEPDRG